MDRYFSKIGLVFALSVALLSTPACSANSASSDTGSESADSDTISAEQYERVTAALKDVPDGEVTRFILTLSTAKDGDVSQQEVSTVLDSLQYAGAKAEWLEGSPVIFATCEKADIYRAVKTGHVSSVQVDRVKSPLK